MNSKSRFFIAALAVAFTLQAVLSMRTKSPTWDETNYFDLGFYILKNRLWDVPASTLHPPLSYYLNSIQSLFYAPDESVWASSSPLNNPQYSNSTDPRMGQKLLTDRRYPKDRPLFWSRIPTVLLALILGLYLSKWASEMYGRPSAMLAMFLFAFSPNILAHARFITPDFPLTCFCFISLYHYWKVVKAGEWRHILMCAFALGFALLSKHSALLLIPVYAILAVVVFFTKETVFLPTTFPLSRFLLKKRPIFKILRLSSLLFIIFSIAIFILLLGYMFHPEFYIKGISYQFQQAAGGHVAFLMGMYSYSGWWFYYLIAVALKTPIPLLIFFVLSLIFMKKNPNRVFLNQAFILAPILVYFLFFSLELKCIGLRYILPIYPFLILQASMVICLRLNGNKTIKGFIFSILCLWYLVSSFSIYPHYLAYFNGFIGGPDQGYKYLVDSNLDWGQDLKGLALYMRERRIDKVHLSYFGTADPRHYGIQYEWMPSYYLPEELYPKKNLYV